MTVINQAQRTQPHVRDSLLNRIRTMVALPPNTLRVGIWGPSMSGKTSYLGALYHQLSIHNQWDVATPGDKAREFVTTIIERFDDCGFPEPTDAAGRSADLYRYIVRPTGLGDRNARQVCLDFVDAPGEFFENIGDPTNMVNDSEPILEYLSKCHGIILLLDYQSAKRRGWSRGRYRKLLRDILLRLQDSSARRGMRLEQHVAFCVTKVDASDEYWAKREAPEELIEKDAGTDLLQGIKNTYCYADRVAFFATSCVGRYVDAQDKGIWHSNVTDHTSANVLQMPTQTNGWGLPIGAPSVPSSQAAIIDPEQINPYNVLEPLAWLITSINKKPPRLMV